MISLLFLWLGLGCINGIFNYHHHWPFSPVGLKVIALGPIGFFVDIKE